MSIAFNSKDEGLKITSAIVEANKDKNEIVGRMESISAVSEQASASTQEVSAATEEITATMSEFTNTINNLNELVEVLESEINKFKL